MAKSKDNVSKRTQHVSSNLRGSLFENLMNSTQVNSRVTNRRPGTLDGTHRSSLGTSDHLREIQFGGPSSSGTKASSGSSSLGALQSVVRQGTSGGLGGLLQSGLGSFGGLGSVVTTLFHIFGGGGKSTPPPLVRFQLPSAQEQTAYIGSSGKSVYVGNVVENGNSQSRSTTQGANGQSVGGHSQQYQSGEIAQAVKTALLTSSTLNDVISEI